MYPIEELIQTAQAAKARALAKYSGFRVGAALLTREGKIYDGINIESSSYGLTICAERVALFKALSEGETGFVAIVIVADGQEYCPPCGACRQVLWDYTRNIDVILARSTIDYEIHPLKELIPMAFEDDFLK